MRIEDYLALKRRLFEKADEVSVAKGHDYSGVDDTLLNLKRVEYFGVVSAERGVLVRLLDKVSRLLMFVEQGVLEVDDESIEDTVVDAVNYLTLFYALVVERRGGGCGG